MDFCYVWLRRLVGHRTAAFEKASTRNPQELTGNEDMGRGLDHFTEGLSTVFQRMANALSPARLSLSPIITMTQEHTTLLL